MRDVVKCAKGLCLGLSLALALVAGAAAQDEPRPERDPVTVGVFGDSLADGLWAGLYWHLRNDPNIAEVLQLSEVSTGITNYTYVDVADKTRDQLAEHHIDIAIFMFGANDMQGIAEDGAVYNFRSAGWQEIYAARIDELTTMLREHGAQIAWVGLPRMRSDRYDNNTIFLNGIFQSRAETFNYPFLEIRSATMAEDGSYNAYLPDGAGTPRLIRADDGIHFTLRGYRLMSAGVADWVSDQAEALRYLPLERPAPVPADLAALNDALSVVIDGQAYMCRAVSADTAQGTP
ncbi:SGNH/GDSL hydrolase family protein [Woodsholea maritima]|uniref:SGNH/GDSL hydrolase family protein n=1 Tax=Woodsholea maritima TaxID=240237 RepID=UPI00036C0D46|nr:GDSL-type esterase/lipase family protein [Woodsholea maritima]